MDLETAQTNTTASLPFSKGEFRGMETHSTSSSTKTNVEVLNYINTRKNTINGSVKAGYDKSKGWSVSYYQVGSLCKECRGLGIKDNSTMKKSSSKLALMAFQTLMFNKSEFNLATYKRGLASVEEQLVFYKKNEVLFCEQLAVLKRDISYKDSEISVLKSELEKLKQEKESNQLKIEKFDNASKSLDKLIGSQIPDKSKKGLGFVSYNVVLPPPTGLFSPPNFDLSNSGLEEFQQPEFEGYGPKTSKSVSEDTSNEVKESPNASLVEELVSNDKLEKKTVFPTLAKINFFRPQQQEKPVMKPVKYAKMYRPKAVNTARPNLTVVNAVRANQVNAVKALACWFGDLPNLTGHPQKEDQGYVDSGCSRHMTGNMSYLSDFKEFNGGYVAFGEEPKEEELLMCDKKNSVLFTDTGCFVLSPDFKLADESQVLLKVPRKNNMYSVDMKNIVPKESLTCLVAKATLDESMLWHRRLGHVNFKTINKLVKENLVRGLPSKRFENDQTCVACLKGKQHKASCKSKIQNSITQPLFMLHMDLFGPTFVSSLMNKKYCLVVTDDYSRFTWVFFLASKDETSGILKSFITEIENLVDKKVKIIRCDNGTEFKNRVMSEFCEKKGIKKEFSAAKNPQQNGVAERRNRTLIEAARTMLADLRKFVGKSNDGFFVGYSMNSKAFRVYNIRTRKVEENLHVRFLEDKPIIAGTNSNDFVGTKESNGAGPSSKEPGSSQDYILMPLWKDGGIDDQERTENSAQDFPIALLESTYADFFGDESELDLSNIATTYLVPSTLNTRIHKDHSLDHVIGDMHSGVQTRRMINEQGFIRRTQEGNPSIKRSKLDRSYARRASAIQITTSLDIGGFTLWQEGHWNQIVDGKEFTITEASVRRHLQLADVDEEGEGSGHPSEPQPPPSPAQPTNEEPIPNVVSSSHQKTQTPRQALNQVTELPQTSEPIPNVPNEAVYEEWDDRVERATTTAASLDAEQASGGSPRCQEAMGVPLLILELTVLCTTLSKKVESLEADLKQTKKVYGAAYTKLIKKVKKLEKTVKSNQARRRAKIVVSDDEEDLEDSSKQGRMIEEIDQDAGVTLVTPTHNATKENVHTYTRRRRAVSTGSGRISTASRLFSTAEVSVSTAGASMPVCTTGMVQEVNISIPSPVVIKDKGKGKMEESKDEQIKRTKLQQEQDMLGHEAAVRL
ncbi:putative ribonuclease H-like domain-containing protein [Tanacetum coccineum]